MTLRTKLKHISNIQTGLFAKTVVKGEIVYLQAKHFKENGKLDSVLHADLKSTYATQKHLLRHGDVLFAAKGTKNFATWYEMNNQPAVASTSFFVIRLNESIKEKVLPEFLVWFINHPYSQKYLKARAIGSAIVSISKAVLGDLEVSVPDLQIQKAILKITELRNTEKDLIKKIETHRENKIQQQLINGLK